MKRLTAYLFALVLVLPALGTAFAQTTTLTFWSWRTEDVDAYDSFIAEFHKTHPDIDVQFTPYKNTEYNTIVSTALQGGGGPDIVHLRAYGGMETLAQAGLLVPLNDKVPALSDFDPNVLKGAINRDDGMTYGVPFALQTVQVLYNKDVFAKLGLSEPTTWSEFVDVAKAIKASGIDAFANGTKDPWTVETLFGGVAPSFYGCNAFYDEITAGKTTFEDPRFKEGLQRMVDLEPYLATNYVGVGYEDMKTIFAYGQAGMLIGGSYELGNMAQLNPDLNIGSFVVPNDQGASCETLYVDGSYGINAASKHQDAAVEFVKFLASKQYGQMFTDTLKQISAVPGVLPTDPVLSVMADRMQSEGTPYLMLTAFRYGTPSGSTLLQNEMQAVMAGDKSIDEAVTNIQRGVATWFTFQ
jgi:raffinose/stachyose/melibiose transport system substrate-binding protein